ncbi:MAG TPA: hypothetical protein DCE42_17680 [Myxococcales bacterium]|nr:hypothetical protein [Deltaproteobacteria bacterium]MBU52949.1 hypothetical protein [Deltaproteobacteria bacterium]HAA56599.1 hypothetical protein [Myxococcales bacterium]
MFEGSKSERASEKKRAAVRKQRLFPFGLLALFYRLPQSSSSSSFRVPQHLFVSASASLLLHDLFPKRQNADVLEENERNEL